MAGKRDENTYWSDEELEMVRNEIRSTRYGPGWGDYDCEIVQDATIEDDRWERVSKDKLRPDEVLWDKVGLLPALWGLLDALKKFRM